MNQCIKIFVGGPRECLPLMRKVVAFASEIDQLRNDITIEAFCWNMDDRRVLTPQRGSIQRRIDDGAVNPTNCDIMVMIFKDTVGSACTVDGTDYPSWSAYEIETTLRRKHLKGSSLIPAVSILRDTFVPPNIDGSLPREERLRQIKELEEREDRHGHLLEYLATLPCPIDELAFAEQFEISVRKHLNELINEVAVPKVEPRCPCSPYRGLEEFGISDGEFFFGRERELKEILDRIDKNPDLGLLYIQGPSGVGKSSLLQAGLLHALTCAGSSYQGIYETYSLFSPREDGANPIIAFVNSIACPSPTLKRQRVMPS